MPKIAKDKQRITTEEQWKSIVYKYLTNPKNTRSKTNFYELLRTKYACEKSKTLKMYTKFELEYDSNKNKGKDEAIAKKEQEDLQKGLISFEEILRKEYEEIELLEKQVKGEVKFTFILGQSIMNSHNKEGNFVVPIEKQIEIKKLIESKKQELRKLRGMYPAANHNVNKIEEVILELI